MLAGRAGEPVIADAELASEEIRNRHLRGAIVLAHRIRIGGADRGVVGDEPVISLVARVESHLAADVFALVQRIDR